MKPIYTVEVQDNKLMIGYWDGNDMKDKFEELTPESYPDTIAYLVKKLNKAIEDIEYLKNRINNTDRILDYD